MGKCYGCSHREPTMAVRALHPNESVLREGVPDEIEVCDRCFVTLATTVAIAHARRLEQEQQEHLVLPTAQPTVAFNFGIGGVPPPGSEAAALAAQITDALGMDPGGDRVVLDINGSESVALMRQFREFVTRQMRSN